MVPGRHRIALGLQHQMLDLFRHAEYAPLDEEFTELHQPDTQLDCLLALVVHDVLEFERFAAAEGRPVQGATAKLNSNWNALDVLIRDP